MVVVVLSLLSLVLVALLLGVHLTGHVALNPVLRAMDFGSYIPVKQALDVTAPRLAKPLLLSSLVATACLLVAASVWGSVSGVVAGAVALVALVVILWTILRGDLPINRAMAGWSAEQPPGDWRSLRARWERFFALRVAANCLALLATGVAALASVLGHG